MRRPVLLLALAALGGAAATATAQDDGAAMPSPCEVAGALCPDLTMREPSQFHLLRTSSGRQLLATTNAIVNVGDGPMEIRGFTNGGGYEMEARQVIRARPPAAAQVLPPSGQVGFYDTRSRGQYWKFQDAARFELRRLGAAGTVGALVRVSPKIYYCFRDLKRVKQLSTGRPYARSPERMVFPACRTTQALRTVTLGTSVGWADRYPWSYPQNWISVGGLRGCFVYRHIADPKDRLVELDETNNSRDAVVRLPWKGPGRRGCPAIATP